jgi:hypothetical protein
VGHGGAILAAAPSEIFFSPQRHKGHKDQMKKNNCLEITFKQEHLHQNEQ